MYQENIFSLAHTLSERKVLCQIVYKTVLNKITTTTGVIRDIFVQQDVPLLILENGLPLSLAMILSITPMEQTY